MAFPLRFTSDFALGLKGQALRMRGRRPSVLRLTPPASGSNEMVLPTADSLEQIVWIGGAEPLQHTQISEYVNRLGASGREVFLQTDGVLLRRRIHEFQPEPRFRFAFRFDGASLAENAEVVAAIRGAQLSGFLVASISVAQGAEDLQRLAALHTDLRSLDLDGSMIVPAGRGAGAVGAAIQARQQLLSRRWSKLSELFDEVLSPESDPAKVVDKSHRKSDEMVGPLTAKRSVP
jgi:hypothetical protein